MGFSMNGSGQLLHTEKTPCFGKPVSFIIHIFGEVLRGRNENENLSNPNGHTPSVDCNHTYTRQIDRQTEFRNSSIVIHPHSRLSICFNTCDIVYLRLRIYCDLILSFLLYIKNQSKENKVRVKGTFESDAFVSSELLLVFSVPPISASLPPSSLTEAKPNTVVTEQITYSLPRKMYRIF